MTPSKRYAIVTPYYKEDRALIQRCIDSVRAQTIKADHIMVADGHPQSWLDGEGVRHIKLDREHRDFGNTPRGVGALLAIGDEYDGIGLLDADNWLDNDHIEKCLQAAADKHGRAELCDYVIAMRRFMRPDGTDMRLREEKGHVDTNCFFFLRGSFSVVPHWAMMPKKVSIICDRVFYQMLKTHSYKYAHVKTHTVNYHSLWESNYRAVGEPMPPGSKPDIQLASLNPWIRSLPPRAVEIVNRLCGFPLLKRVTLKQRPGEDEGQLTGAVREPVKERN